MSPVSGPQQSPSQTQPASVLGAVQVAPNSSVHTDAPQAHIPTDVASGQTNANPPHVSPVTNLPQQPSENISPSIPSRPQPKRVRKAELPDDLIARDLDWFKSSQASIIVTEDLGASSSKVDETSPSLASDTVHVPGWSPSLKKKTARMVPSRRLPRRVSDVVQEAESGADGSVLPPASEPSAEENRSFDNAKEASVHEQKPYLEGMESDAPIAAIPEVYDTRVSPQLVVSSNEPPIKPEIPQTDYLQQLPSVDGSLLYSDSAIFHHPSSPLPDTKLDGLESMDISASELSSEAFPSEPPGVPEFTPPQSPQALRLQSPILPPLVKAWEPPLDLSFNISPMAPDPLQQDANQRRFDGEMTVIHTMQGRPSTHTHVIDITLNESLFAKISKWANRKSHPSCVARRLA